MKTTLALSAVLLVAANSLASISITDSTPYTQNFDTLAASGGSSITWANDSTLSGWSLFRQPAPGTAIVTYGADNGTSTTGNFWSYGTTSSSERALGGLGSGGAYFGSPSSGNIAGWIAAAFVNNSGSTFEYVSIQYDGEQWRNSAAAAQTMVVEWGIGSSFTTVSSWTAAGAAFDFTSPVTGGTAGAIDGNVAGKVTGIGGTISSIWNNGDTLWVRWIERNDVGNDHGLAVDNFQLIATVPEPSMFALLGLGAAGFLAIRRRKN